MLVAILFLIFAAFCTASMSMFLDYCMTPGNIFSGYYKWLCKVSKAKFERYTDSEGNMYEKLVSAKWFYNPLGGCVKCMNVYVGIIPFFYIAITQAFTWHFGIMAFFAFQSLSYYFLVKQLNE